MNHLEHEQSPYLQQHVQNPVDWYPWGELAFARARTEERLIFLSIGYSTCHWCHVMAHESFEDEEVAALLNRDYVAVKVDREERPDIDQVYMDICVQWTGGGGWPLTIIITPDGLPVFAATYLPKRDRHGRPGLLSLLPLVAQKWYENPGQFRQLGRQLVARLTAARQPAETAPVDSGSLDVAVKALLESFDHRHGGFGGAPKFPSPHNLGFLLQRHRRTGDRRLVEMVEASLDAMRDGGLQDHLGGGFHRYATDAAWRVPHFEKMLYDQAGLATACLEAFLVTGADRFAETTRAIIDYVLRDMTAETGGFYSAEDADSEGVEGKFYVWTADEVDTVLGAGCADLFKRVYGVTPVGNYHDEATGVLTGTNILFRSGPIESFAEASGLSVQVLQQRLEDDRSRLLAVRQRRPRPHRDEKVLTAWNALMVSALSRVGMALGETRYVQAAMRAAGFLRESLRDGEGNLLRRYRSGVAGIHAFASDHAFLAAAQLDLYAATHDVAHLREAVEVARQLWDRFQDEPSGRFYETAEDSEPLVMRPRQVYDGALPAASSVALEVYARLFLLTGDSTWAHRAERLLAGVSPEVTRYPAGCTRLLQGLALLVEPTREIVIAGRRGEDLTEALLRAAAKPYAPETQVLFLPLDDPAPVTVLAPFAEALAARAREPAAYVCQNFHCLNPVTNPNDLDRLLRTMPG